MKKKIKKCKHEWKITKIKDEFENTDEVIICSKCSKNKNDKFRRYV